MGFFDWYQPQEKIICPGCGRELKEWQGYAGPNGLFVWRQGEKYPVDQRVDEELRVSPRDNPAIQLPETFTIRATECDCPYTAEATGYLVSGVWRKTELVTIVNANQHKHETRAQWSARRKWLESVGNNPKCLG